VQVRACLCFITVLSLSLATASVCRGVTPQEHSAAYTLHFFSDADDVKVMTHYGNYDLQLDNELALGLQWTHDVVVIPALESAPQSPEAIDAITTASRPISSENGAFEDFVKARESFEGSLRAPHYNTGYYLSTESDYFAQMLWVGYNRDLWNDNLNLSTGISYAWDDIQPLDDADTTGRGGKLQTRHWNVIATQILSPTTVFRLGGEINAVRGLQHDTYRNVYAGGTNVPERHPDRRSRYDVFCRLSQYLHSRASVKLDYRFYTDDWSVSSHATTAKLSQYVNDALVVNYRYRYYTQVEAEFFREEYPSISGIDGYLTGDYRLGGFGAHLFGFLVQWNMKQLFSDVDFLSQTRLRFGYERYFNSNNFTANIMEVGIDLAF